VLRKEWVLAAATIAQRGGRQLWSCAQWRAVQPATVQRGRDSAVVIAEADLPRLFLRTYKATTSMRSK